MGIKLAHLRLKKRRLIHFELGVNTRIIRGGVLEAGLGHELKKGLYRRAYLFKLYNVSI